MIFQLRTDHYLCINKSIKSAVLVVAFLILSVQASFAMTVRNSDLIIPKALSISIKLSINGNSYDLERDVDFITDYFSHRIEDGFFSFPLRPNVNMAKSNLLKSDVYDFEDYPQAVLPSDLTWKEDPFSNRSWVLLMHSWYFLDDLIYGYNTTADWWFINRIRWIAKDWLKDNLVSPPPSIEFSWYDNTIPKRIFQAIKAFNCLKSGNQLDKESVKTLLTLLYIHAEIISNEDYIYIKNHNHGLDQSFKLFQLSQFFPEFQKSKSWEKISLERLKNEISFAMADDGVHKENSPAYHNWLLGYIYEIEKTVNHCLKINLRGKSPESYLEMGLSFLVSMFRPDNYAVSLGDTSGSGKKGKFTPDIDVYLNSLPKNMLIDSPTLNKIYDNFLYAKSGGRKGVKPNETKYLFPDSGYYIYRDLWDKPGENNALHLVFKSGFLSPAHRHDDDNNILLYAFGEDWLIDTGKYGYAPSEYRTHAMSAKAHNISRPLGAFTTRSLSYRTQYNAWGITSENDSLTEVTGKSFMFRDYVYERKLQIAGNHSFFINDRIWKKNGAGSNNKTLQKEKPTFVSQFIVPMDKKVYINQFEQSVHVLSSDNTKMMTIKMPVARQDEIFVISGEGDNYLSFETVGPSKFIPAKTILFFHRGDELNINFQVILKDQLSDVDEVLKNSSVASIKKTLPHKENKIYQLTKIDENIYTIELDIDSSKSVAFYQFANNSLASKSQYENKNKFTLFLPKAGNFNYTFFIADKYKKYRDDNRIIFSIPSITVKKNLCTLSKVKPNLYSLSVHAPPVSYSFAYYLYKDEKIVHKSKYFNDTNLKISIPNPGSYRIKVFLADKSKKYLDPNKFSFFLSEKIEFESRSTNL